MVFEGYEAQRRAALDYTGSALGHDIAGSFRAAGARARLKAALDARARPTQLDADVEALNLAVIDPDLPQTALRAQAGGARRRQGRHGQARAREPATPGRSTASACRWRASQAAFSTDFATLRCSRPEGVAARPGRAGGQRRASRAAARASSCACASSTCAACARTSRSTRLAGQLALSLEPKRQRVQGTLAQDDMSLTADAERSGDVVEVRALRARAAGGEASGSGRAAPRQGAAASRPTSSSRASIPRASATTRRAPSTAA